MLILQALMAGFLSTASYRQGKYHTLWQAASDATVACFGGSPVATFSKEDLTEIIYYIYEFVGQIGYKSYALEDRGFTFVNETKNRVIVYEFPFGQIKPNLDSLTYNRNIADIIKEQGKELCGFGGMCIWGERMECNENNCNYNSNSCGWALNIGLSFDYISEHGKPFFNFFKDDFKGTVAVWNNDGNAGELMHESIWS